LLKTNAQKKWAVKTRPFGREVRIVALPALRCKRPEAEEQVKSAEIGLKRAQIAPS
jgi:hypothetical protein